MPTPFIQEMTDLLKGRYLEAKTANDPEKMWAALSLIRSLEPGPVWIVPTTTAE